MRYLLFIKGDGRGHITQGLALTDLLRERGHEVAALIIGCPPTTTLPAFLFKRSPVPVQTIFSPNFVMDSRARGIHLRRTILHTARHQPALLQSRRQVVRLLRDHRPDVLLNLYEPILTLTALTARHTAPVLHISHQALMLHPQFTFPKGRASERALVQNYTRFVCLKAKKLLALSFYDLPDEPKRRLYPVAPLLRPEVFAREPTEGAHILVYLLNHGLAKDLEAYHARRPQVKIEAFWNNPDAPPVYQVNENLTFHRLSDTLFLDKMAACRGVACTAGFETVCEAFYYRKPAILMPAPNQYEQYVNAFDAEKVGAGRRVESLDLNQLDDFITAYRPQHEAYLHWLQTGREKLIHHLENP
jgi:uncharacterized protein (TIGR00661 family)